MGEGGEGREGLVQYNAKICDRLVDLGRLLSNDW